MYIHMYAITINEERSHEFEKERGRVYRRVGREKHNYIITSQIKKKGLSGAQDCVKRKKRGGQRFLSLGSEFSNAFYL